MFRKLIQQRRPLLSLCPTTRNRIVSQEICCRRRLLSSVSPNNNHHIHVTKETSPIGEENKDHHRTTTTQNVNVVPPPYIQNDASTTHFGFEQVHIHEKENRVRQVFNNVADSYDVMNDFMSGGLHRLWKDYFVSISQVPAISRAVRKVEGFNPPIHQQQQQQQNPDQSQSTDSPETPLSSHSLRILDVAGGTGDVAFRFIDVAGCIERTKSSGLDPISVTICDINTEMLRVGEQRARQRYGNELIDNTKALQFQQGNAQHLYQFSNNTFDLYTIAFGLRNVTDVDAALVEAYRVLKPGGRFMCLEFSQVPNPILRSIYDTYSFGIIPTMGEIIANDRQSYQYLVESIRKFSNQEELIARMENAGLRNNKYTNLTGGIVAIHEGWKPLE